MHNSIKEMQDINRSLEKQIEKPLELYLGKELERYKKLLKF